MAAKRAQKASSLGSDASFEEILGRLESLVDQLEGGDLPLEKALNLFEEGIRLSSLGSKRLDEAELKVEQLLADPDEKKRGASRNTVSKS